MIRKTIKLRDDQGTVRVSVMKVADAASQSITSVGLGDVRIDGVGVLKVGLKLTGFGDRDQG